MLPIRVPVQVYYDLGWSRSELDLISATLLEGIPEEFWCHPLPQGGLAPRDVEVRFHKGEPPDITMHQYSVFIRMQNLPERAANLQERTNRLRDRLNQALENASVGVSVELSECAYSCTY